jgi:hypothetical protein
MTDASPSGAGFEHFAAIQPPPSGEIGLNRSAEHASRPILPNFLWRPRTDQLKLIVPGGLQSLDGSALVRAQLRNRRSSRGV